MNLDLDVMFVIEGGPKKFVSLEFVSMSTECTYDYLFVYNGPSFNDDLLGAFSGESDPGTLVAKSVVRISLALICIVTKTVNEKLMFDKVLQEVFIF